MPLLVRRPARDATLCVVLATVAAGCFAAEAVAHKANMENGLTGFDQVTTAGGSFTTSGKAAQGARSARAVYDGNGVNGYARGLFEVSWPAGASVTYRASFYLPRGFHHAMQGQVALMRWDNWPQHGGSADYGGLVISEHDKRARLVTGDYGGRQESLGKAFRLPEGRWFTATVRQRFSTRRPRSRIAIDGGTAASSHRRNFGGRSIQRVRYGIVAIAAGEQRRPLRLWLDGVSARRR